MDSGFGSVALVVALAVMAFGTVAAFLPLVPGPVLVWLGALIYGALTGFRDVGVITIVILTLLMIVGTTSDLWMAAIGVKSTGGSIWGVLGGIAGMLVGLLFFFPVGPIVGAVAGTLIVEFMYSGDVRRSLRSGGVTFGSYILGIAVEFLSAVLMDVVFIATLLIAHRPA